MTRRSPKTQLALVASLVGLALVAGPGFATPATRVASLVPFVSEALTTIGDPAITLVATTRSQTGWVPPAGVTDLGNAHAPDLERLAAAGATLLIADRRWHTRVGERAGSLGMEVFWIEAESVAATLGELERLGTKIGASKPLAVAIGAVREAITAIKLESGHRVLAVFGAPGNFLLATRDTWLGDLVGQIGGTLVVPSGGSGGNIASGFPGYLPISDEFLAAVELDTVVLVAHGDPKAVGEAFSREWNRLRGNAQSPVIALDPARFGVNPGLGLARAAAELVQLLDPSVKVDPPAEAGTK